MDFSDHTEQGNVPPLSLIYSGYDGGNTSAEDLAWADSCLCPDLELPKSGLNSFRSTFALLGVHGSQHKSSVDVNGEFCEAADKKNFPISGKGRASPMLDDKTTYDPLRNGQEGWSRIDCDQISETTDTFNSKFNLENVFLPAYNENQRIFVTADPELDSIFPAFVEDQPAENIFKVWELDIPDEEDELILQVEKALAESSLEPEASVSEDSGLWVGSDDLSFDDLISGIADLSLSGKSS